MNRSQLKEALIKKIKSTDNEEILNKILRILEIENADTESYDLSEDQIKVVNEAREQVKKGQFLTHDEAQKKIDQWLNR